MCSILNQFFGLETLIQVEKPNVKTSNDAALILVHWSLTSNGLLCVGLGEEFQTVGPKSELLPGGWSGDSSVYSVKYQDRNNKNFLLKAIAADDILIISFLDMKTEKSSDLSINSRDEVTIDTEVTFVNLEEFVKKIKNDLIEKVIGPEKKLFKDGNDLNKRDNKHQKTGHDDDPLLVGGGRGGRVDPGMPGWGGIGAPPLGGSDLDPMGGIMGGGMLMDPRQSGRMGHPMQPRFDPVGPGMGGGIGPLGGGLGIGPMRGGRGGRNFGDAMRPPDWDNMYM